MSPGSSQNCYASDFSLWKLPRFLILLCLSYAPEALASCISFRQTRNCSAHGPRQPTGDRACNEVVPCHEFDCPSGYCECQAGQKVHFVDCKPGSHESFTCATECSSRPSACQAVPGPRPRIVLEGHLVVLGNGYTCVTVSLAGLKISELRADFTGKGEYGLNVLDSHGVTLERLDADGTLHSSAEAGAPTAQVTKSSDELVEVVITGIADAAGNVGAVAETWRLSLRAAARSVDFSTNGTLQRDVSAKALRHSFAFAPTSIYGLFDRGIVQMRGYDAGLIGNVSTRNLGDDAGLPNIGSSGVGAEQMGHYASKDRLGRFYALGGAGGDLDTAGNMSVAVRRGIFKSAGIVLLNSGRRGLSGYSGFHEVLAGNLPTEDIWTQGWSNVSAVQLSKGLSWKTFYEIAPNNFDFPAQGPYGDLTTAGNIENRDLQALLTGIYASPVGQLCTHDNGVVKGKRVGQMATTIASPGYGYTGAYNFFDPDNYISTAAMLFSGDPYLQEQVRVVLEHNGDYINEKGQLPHHFLNTTPTYQALSGQTQTGPNVFWILSCFNYVKTTGKLDWLKRYMPKLRHASAFLFHMIEPGFNLLKSSGTLMIDVFIRSNFTTDTNAMMVGFFREFADAEAATGNATAAEQLRAIATSIAEATNSMLWSNTTKDHYVTQLNTDGTIRDFVDYDANLIALAHGIPSAERAKKAFARIDSGRCVHGRATFVSELYYGKNDTTNGNVGDSACSMGRIGWFDSLARKRYGDQHTFDSLLDPLVGDVNRWTWLHERYDCDGKPQQFRTPFYFEYPSVTAMMIHFVRYGIQLGFESVTVSPFGPKAFVYHVGNIHIDYNASADTVRFSTPGIGMRNIAVEGLTPGATYTFKVGPGPAVPPWPTMVCALSGSGSVIAGSDSGSLNFRAGVGDAGGQCVIEIGLAEVTYMI